VLLQIPVDNTLYSQQFTITLEGTLYTMHIYWVDRDGRWYMDLSDGNGNLIVGGVALVLAIDLLGKFNEAAIPPGMFYMFDTTGTNTEASLTNFGQSVLLYYMESTGP